ncbi:MAG: hypothetical protein IT198_07800 [Acidimicrobiia bacterium]|nr:hypothetical protein [Acidimicrobiia bacterium]
MSPSPGPDTAAAVPPNLLPAPSAPPPSPTGNPAGPAAGAPAGDGNGAWNLAGGNAAPAPLFAASTAPTPGTAPPVSASNWGSSFGQPSQAQTATGAGATEVQSGGRFRKLLIPVLVLVAALAVAVFVFKIPERLSGGEDTSTPEEVEIEGTDLAVTPPAGWQAASGKQSGEIEANMAQSGLPVKASAAFVRESAVLAVTVLELADLTPEALQTMTPEALPPVQLPPLQVTKQEARPHALGPGLYVEATNAPGQALVQFVYRPGEVIVVALMSKKDLQVPDDLGAFGQTVNSLRSGPPPSAQIPEATAPPAQP